MNNLKRILALMLSLSLVLGLVACTGGDTGSTTSDPTVQTTAPTETTSPATLPTEEPSNTTVVGGNEAITILNETGDVIYVSIQPESDGDPLPFRDLTAAEIVAEMGTGWNLGNTMDGHTGFTPNETLWQDTETTQALISAVHDLGFNTVRIPITWGTMINDDYSINEKWISRVQDIVDYCIHEDMYVIINIHHDGADESGWLQIGTDDLEGLFLQFAGVWKSIAMYFRDYDEHLIFESMNEVYGSQDMAADNDIIMDLNQIFVNVVRSTGSNNARRWLSVPGRYTNVEAMTNEKYGFEMPDDAVEGRIFAAVHWYNWAFAMYESMTYTTFTDAMIEELVADFQKLETRFTSQGIPVIMGEYGAVNKNNPEQRAYHNEIFNLLAKAAGVVPVYWDQGWYDRTVTPADYSFTLVDRVTCQPVDKEVTDALMRGFFKSAALSYTDITVSPQVVEITGIELGQTQVDLTIGDIWYADVAVTPAENNDVLLWKTDDHSVATVYNGMIRARGIGTTTVTAYSQSGSVEAKITVTVQAASGTTTAITTDADAYQLVEGKYGYIQAEAVSGDADAYLTYRSSDPSVVTVNSFGKIVAVAPGTAEITVTSSDGCSKTVTVTVEEFVSEQILRLALNVLFNDADLGCYNNETGPVIEIWQDGTYTVTFSFAEDASEATKKLGVTGLNNLTAIYIKDYDVTAGNIKRSNLTACMIRWDSVVVDGVELTLNTSDYKSAIKASGILDTNDPLNSWDGSAVEEVTVTNHVLNILLDDPQTITVTFTITGLTFKE